MFIPETAGVPSKNADLLRIILISAPRLFGGPLLDRAAHFWVSLISSSKRRNQQNTCTDFKRSKEEIKVGKIFYIHDLVHARIHTPVLFRKPENWHLRLGTKRIWFCLFVTIATMVRPSQGTSEGPRTYSLSWVSGRLLRSHSHQRFFKARALATFLQGTLLSPSCCRRMLFKTINWLWHKWDVTKLAPSRAVLSAPSVVPP